MKIYVITEGSYSDYHIVALCEDKEKAECVAEKVCGEVEEYETKDADILCKKIPYSRIYIDTKTGNVIWIEQLSIEDNDYYDEYAKNFEWVKPIQRDGKRIFCFITYVQTKEKEKAIKIARDRWAAYKARANDV
jgi:hypothetical protein